jgi:hypothetical protein
MGRENCQNDTPGSPADVLHSAVAQMPPAPAGVLAWHVGTKVYSSVGSAETANAAGVLKKARSSAE